MRAGGMRTAARVLSSTRFFVALRIRLRRHRRDARARARFESCMRGVATVPASRASRTAALRSARSPRVARPSPAGQTRARRPAPLATGYCTRAEAKRWWGRASHPERRPGQRHDASVPVTTGELLIDGEPLDHPDGLVAMLHKPRGSRVRTTLVRDPTCTTSSPHGGARNPTVEAVGRPDKDTTGLLLLTDDGELLHRLTSPKKDVQDVRAGG